MQAKRLLAQKKAAAQKKQGSGAAAAAAREAKERAKKAKGKKDKSHFNQVILAYALADLESSCTKPCGLSADLGTNCCVCLVLDTPESSLARYAIDAGDCRRLPSDFQQRVVFELQMGCGQ